MIDIWARFSRTGVGLCLLALCVTPSQAAALDLGPSMASGKSLMRGYSVSLDYFVDSGHTPISGASSSAQPLVTGLRYYERQGMITGLTTAIFSIVAGAYGSAQPKGYDVRYTSTHKITTTTYRSDAEKAQMQARANRQAQRAASRRNQSFELELYSPSLPGLQGQASGFKANMFFAADFKSWMLDFGFGVGKAASRTFAADSAVGVNGDFGYIGIPLRANVPIGSLLTYAQAEVNFAGFQVPVRLGVMASFLGRINAELALITPHAPSFQFGYRAAVGARF